MCSKLDEVGPRVDCVIVRGSRVGIVVKRAIAVFVLSSYVILIALSAMLVMGTNTSL